MLPRRINRTYIFHYLYPCVWRIVQNWLMVVQVSQRLSRTPLRTNDCQGKSTTKPSQVHLPQSSNFQFLCFFLSWMIKEARLGCLYREASQMYVYKFQEVDATNSPLISKSSNDKISTWVCSSKHTIHHFFVTNIYWLTKWCVTTMQQLQLKYNGWILWWCFAPPMHKSLIHKIELWF